ncbi:MAG: type IX secretion system membrane protein PorP/SprF [Bacteroidia bacterium]|nr:type IX secretion system membrane protein PorP/SprF [Bacteroidia bacterium]
MPSSLVWAQPLAVNPALAGIQDAKSQIRFSHLFRRMVTSQNGLEVSGFEMAYQSQLGIEMPIRSSLMDGGWGILVGTEHWASLRTNYLKIIGAYVVPLGAKVRYAQLRAGIEVGLLQKSLNESTLYLESQFSGTSFTPTYRYSISSFNQIRPDLGISLLWSRQQKIKGNPEINYFIGASMHHITRPTFNFTGIYADISLPIRYRLVGGIKYRTRSPFDFNYALSYERQGLSFLVHNSFFIRYALLKNALLFSESKAFFNWGFHLRNLETLIAFTGVEYAHKYLLGLSYELPIGNPQLENIYFGGIHFLLGLLLKPGVWKENQHPIPQF